MIHIFAENIFFPLNIDIHFSKVQKSYITAANI